MSKFDPRRFARDSWARLGEIDPLEWIGIAAAIGSVIFVVSLFLC